jgi:transposase
MIDTERYAQIRQCKNQGLSMRQTATLLHMSRHTVKKYWDGAHTPDEKRAYPETVTSAHKEVVMAALEKYFEETKALSSGKQQVTARNAWLALRDTHSVGESTIRRYVRELKAKKPEGFIPLSFEPGEVMQVDWCEVKVSIQGQIYKAPLFCAVLPYSYAIFAMIMPDMKMPRFIEGHREAFQAFHGIPQRVFYDNLRTAVFAGTGPQAVKQKHFRMFEAHYAFEAVFMNAEAGWEKGAVENLCGLIRPVACTPIPQGKNLKEIQDTITQRCLEYIRFHKIRDRKDPIAPMFETEKLHLNPLPIKPFEAYAESQAVVHSDLTFRYDAIKYSVPSNYIGKTITIRASSYRIEAWYKGTCIASHIRPFQKNEHQYIPEHYLDLLEKRPRAINNAAPLKFGVLPPELERFRKDNRAQDKYEQLANVLLLGRHVDADLLLKAVDYANKSASPTLQTVKFYLQLHQDTLTADQVRDPVAVDPPHMLSYDALLGNEGDDYE